MRAAQKAVVGNSASPNLESLIILLLPVLGRAGDDRQVFRHLDIVGAVDVRAEGEQIALGMQFSNPPPPWCFWWLWSSSFGEFLSSAWRRPLE